MSEEFEIDNFEDLMNVFENTGDFGKYYLGDYSNIQIANYLRKMQQENKQLKKELDLQFKDLMKRIQENNDEYLEEKNKLIKENHHLKSILTELEESLKEKWYEIEPKGTGINFNCEYDSEEDYVRGMETKSKLDTLKNTLDKIQKLKEKYKNV